MTTLEEIVAYTRTLVERRKAEQPLSDLKDEIAVRPPALDFAAALNVGMVALIAEVKKASPSRGLIRSDFDHLAIAEAYALSGASAVSVLTEPRFFLGTLDYLADVASSPIAHSVPLLRKDFIIDPYQVYEARAHGADAVLLIAAILDRERLDSLLALSHDFGMMCLVEVHNERDIDLALSSEARVIGINNRDLHSFKVDLSTFELLRPLVPAEKLVVAESGIHGSADIRRLARVGVDAVLVGEALMTADDIAAMTREFACAA